MPLRGSASGRQGQGPACSPFRHPPGQHLWQVGSECFGCPDVLSPALKAAFANVLACRPVPLRGLLSPQGGGSAPLEPGCTPTGQREGPLGSAREGRKGVGGLQEGKPKKETPTEGLEGTQREDRAERGRRWGAHRGERHGARKGGARLGLGPGPGPLGPEETACRTPCSVSGLLLSGEAWQPAE